MATARNARSKSKSTTKAKNAKPSAKPETKPQPKAAAKKPSPRTSASTMTIAEYDAKQPSAAAAICTALRSEIESALKQAKSMVWHGSPVWFVGETPVVGYCTSKRGDVQLLFWNGRSFDDARLIPLGSFSAAQIRYASKTDIDLAPLRRWLRLAGTKPWDLAEVRARRAKG